MLLASCFDAAPLRWLGGLSAATFPVALIALGAARGGRIDRLRWPLALLWIVLAGSWIALLALPDGGPDAGALPLGTALMLFVMVPVPFAIVCWAYASWFDLSEEDVERIRRLGRHDQGGE